MSGGTPACHVLHTFVAQRTRIDSIQQMFPRTKQDGRDDQVQLIDECSLQILPDRGYATTQSDVLAICGGPRLLKRGFNTVGDEPEFRTAFHPEWCSRVMSQHEDGCVIRRFITPPASPTVIWPWTTDGAEHVSSKNPGADPVEALRRKIIVYACLAAFIAVHPLEGTRVEEPVKQLRTADSERVLKILARPSTVSVD
jgi:hypothetical protein